MNKWSLTLLIILTSAIIAILLFTSRQSFWTISAPILSIILGWLLKTISDSVTISQEHQWDLEKIADERTLKYYETKLSEMSSYILDEFARLASANWASDGNSKFTKEWIGWASSTRTFVEVISDNEIVTVYIETADQSSKWLHFVDEFNSGKFDKYEKEQMQIKLQDEMGLYMSKLRNFQTAIERVRLKILRGEVVIKRSDGR